jgi:hypothetical protein
MASQKARMAGTRGQQTSECEFWKESKYSCTHAGTSVARRGCSTNGIVAGDECDVLGMVGQESESESDGDRYAGILIDKHKAGNYRFWRLRVRISMIRIKSSSTSPPLELTFAIHVEPFSHFDLAQWQQLAERASRHYADHLQGSHIRLPELYAVFGTCQPFRLSGRRAVSLLLRGQWSPITP